VSDPATKLMALLAEWEEKASKATKGPWLEAGPYPGTSVCIEISGGNVGPDDPEPPEWQPICVLDDRQTGEPSAEARADGAFIAHARTALPAAYAALRVLVDALSRYDGIPDADGSWGSENGISRALEELERGE